MYSKASKCRVESDLQVEELSALERMIYYCERQLTFLAPACASIANLLRYAIATEIAARALLDEREDA